MAQAKETIRNYRMNDADMLVFAGTIVGQFKADKADFVKHDPDFDGTFENDWRAAIAAAVALPTDEAVLDEQEGFTKDVENKMEACRHKFQVSKRFIEKAFPENVPVWNEFGFDDYDNARNVQSTMMLFMENFHRVANKYKNELNAKNYTQTHIDEIKTLSDALQKANERQESAKAGRPVVTQNRIITLNKAWDITADVCRAGKDIFHDNAAKVMSYLLPVSESAGAEPVIPGVVGEVKAAETNVE